MKTYLLITAALVAAPHLVQAPQLAKVEADGLRYMREEEKLARDVYRQLEIKWGARLFGNISRAEETHIASVKTLLDTYKLDDPAAANPAGKFTNKDLQKLYADLVSKGSKSRVDALQVGCLIEELDIKDLQDRSAQTQRPDIKSVYDNLTRGSRNHLRAFYGALKQAGGSYTPAHLSKTAFDQIVSSPMERGRGGSR